MSLASSRDYRDRADAGQAMATFADLPQAQEPLLRLLLDADDTFVTRVTAHALLRRQDTVGVAAVASALATADAGHRDWIRDAVVEVFGIFASQRDAAVQICAALADSPDPVVRRGSGQLRDWLTEINPVLHPAIDDPT